MWSSRFQSRLYTSNGLWTNQNKYPISRRIILLRPIESFWFFQLYYFNISWLLYRNLLQFYQFQKEKSSKYFNVPITCWAKQFCQSICIFQIDSKEYQQFFKICNQRHISKPKYIFITDYCSILKYLCMPIAIGFCNNAVLLHFLPLWLKHRNSKET